MKPRKFNPLLWLLILGIIIIIILLLKYCGSHTNGPVSRIPGVDSPYRAPRYHENQLVLFFKRPPTAEQLISIKKNMKDYGIDTGKITIERCDNCGDNQVELWNAPKIETYVHSEPVKGGASSNPGSKGVGEDSLAYYTQNYIISAPPEINPAMPYDRLETKLAFPPPFRHKKDTVRVAILDTGIDPALLSNQQYFWKNPGERSNNTDDDKNCLTDDINGWNFVDSTNQTGDDSRDGHGTRVALFIMNEFQRDNTNALQLMILKTHDANAEGDLFNIICAICYAADKHANIINASWGYYSHYNLPSPYVPLDSVITKMLADSGILFVTAAGNRMADADDSALHVGIKPADLRNLNVHHFYPACLGDSDNNILVATTTNDTAVSLTQNYSTMFVSIGVLADEAEDGYLKFKVPFVLSQPQYVSGSSFATAIATGKIAALCRPALFKHGLKGKSFITDLGTNVIVSDKLAGQVNKGRYIRHH
jgi:hypothetical protein